MWPLSIHCQGYASSCFTLAGIVIQADDRQIGGTSPSRPSGVDLAGPLIVQSDDRQRRYSTTRSGELENLIAQNDQPLIAQAFFEQIRRRGGVAKLSRRPWMP